MADLVIDEWLWADLAGENGRERQLETHEFIEALRRSEDRFIVVAGSRFAEKAAGFWRHSDAPRRAIAKLFKDELLYDSTKCHIVAESDLVALPADVAEVVKNDDHYLVRALITCTAKAIVTTDAALLDALRAKGFSGRERGGFVSEYLRRKI